jgi:uncharacterized protein (DUF433 family)
MRSDLLQRITVDSGVCGGRPCVRGLRIRVIDVLDLIAFGAAETEILQNFPYLEADDLRAAVAYAAAYLDHSVIPTRSASTFSSTPIRLRNRNGLNSRNA